MTPLSTKYPLAKTRAPSATEITAPTRPAGCPELHRATPATLEEPMNSGLTVRHTLPQWSPKPVAIPVGEYHQGQYAQCQAAHPGDSAGAQPEPPDAGDPHEQRSNLPQLPGPVGERTYGQGSTKTVLSVQAKMARARKVVAAAAGTGPKSLGAMSLNISQYYYHAHLAPELITLDLKL